MSCGEATSYGTSFAFGRVLTQYQTELGLLARIDWANGFYRSNGRDDCDPDHQLQYDLLNYSRPCIRARLQPCRRNVELIRASAPAYGETSTPR